MRLPNKSIKLSLNSANDALRKFLRRQKLSYFKLAVSKLLSLSFSVLLFLLVLLIVDCKLFPVSSVYAEKDSIVLRTIITPIGSQSEKWGAAGLMVCIGGKAINQGGCGPITTVNKGWKIKEDGTREEIEIKTNDIVIFKDTYGPLGKPNHQFDYTPGNELQSDTVYEVRGSGLEGQTCDTGKVVVGVDEHGNIICISATSSSGVTGKFTEQEDDYICSGNHNYWKCTSHWGKVRVEEHTHGMPCFNDTHDRCFCDEGTEKCETHYDAGIHRDVRECFCVVD